VPLIVVAGFVIYSISYHVRRGPGITLGAAFKKIPLE
jgi:hypothetical protein